MSDNPKRRVFAPQTTTEPQNPAPNPVIEQIATHQLTRPVIPATESTTPVFPTPQPTTTNIQPCPEEILRLSVNCFPQTAQLEKEAAIPLGVTVQALAPTQSVC